MQMTGRGYLLALGLPGQFLKWGPVMPAGAFFISGFPGGISYLMLGLYKVHASRRVAFPQRAPKTWLAFTQKVPS